MLAVVRQLTGLVVLASVYVSVKSLSKRIGCILVGIQFNKQSVAPGDKNEVFVDLFCKVTDDSLMSPTFTILTFTFKYFSSVPTFELVTGDDFRSAWVVHNYDSARASQVPWLRQS